MIEYITKIIERYDILSGFAQPIAIILAVGFLLVLAVAANLVAKHVIVGNIQRVLTKSTSTRDDILIKNRVFHRLSHLAPAFVFFLLSPKIFAAFPQISQAFVVLSLIYMVVVGVLFVDTLINAGLELYKTYAISKSFPITSFVQIGKIILYFLGVISVLSLMLGESPLTFLAGLGALAAVFMFVFKDPILGFVAGIQLTANRMVAVGDWIEMPKFGVDGDVIEIALTTVKIHNFDKTITTIPTYSLISDSFKNWRGMTEAGGRRIKRSIFVDVSSVRFCDEEMLDRYSKIQYIEAYLNEKREEILKFNEDAKVDNATLVNGRRLTNVGTFRAYLEAYLRNHPYISKNMTLLVRQLQPTEIGLPIEIYVFTNITDWLQYESIQADIFDHILAAAREFNLHVFQNPSGADFQRFGKSVPENA